MYLFVVYDYSLQRQQTLFKKNFDYYLLVREDRQVS